AQQIFWTSTIRGLRLPLISIISPVDMLYEAALYSMLANMFGYEIVYIDVLPVFNLADPTDITFDYFTPIIGNVSSDSEHIGDFHIDLISILDSNSLLSVVEEIELAYESIINPIDPNAMEKIDVDNVMEPIEVDRVKGTDGVQ
ncbi:MAG: hypothetical protein PHU12_02610, partial [Candidatus Aenigmarchaeota archaeon]|nr:hypothetical protein [Candidatus Aenigmarchaeota archaeon]